MKKILIVSTKNDSKKFETFVHSDIEKNIIMDEILVCAKDLNFLNDYDLIFLRIKNMEVINILKNSGCRTKIINTPESILNTYDRFKALSILENAGIKVPKQFRNREHADCTVFKKNPMDIKLGKWEKLSAEGWNKQADTAQEPIYAQQFIDSEWEYKIYVVFDKIWCFKQKPTFYFPDKISTRVSIPKEEAPWQEAVKAVKSLGLVMSSVDFLKEGNTYYLSDININAGMQYIDGGYSSIMTQMIEYIS